MPVVRNEVFVSYAHADEKWKDRLLMQLAPLIREGNIRVWHDGLIQTGAKWESEIEQALMRAHRRSARNSRIPRVTIHHEQGNA
jgi:hypothetical protein